MVRVLVQDAWCAALPLIFCLPFFTLNFNLQLDPQKRLMQWFSSVANQVVFWFLFKVALKLSTSPSRLEVSVQFIGVPEIALSTKCLAEVTTIFEHIRCVPVPVPVNVVVYILFNYHSGNFELYWTERLISLTHAIIIFIIIIWKET